MAVIECHTTGFIEKYFKYGYTSAEDYQELITYLHPCWKLTHMIRD